MWHEVEQVHIFATTGVANRNIENLIGAILVTNDALIEVDSAPSHTNHLRLEKNPGGVRTRGQGR